MRTIIDIPQDILDGIDGVAKELNISRAEAVRRAIAEYVKERSRARPDAAFGIWKFRKIDSLAYEDSIRGEWDK